MLKVQQENNAFLHTIEPCQQEPSFFEALDAKKSLSLAKNSSKAERYIFPGIYDNHDNKNKKIKTKHGKLGLHGDSPWQKLWHSRQQ